MASCGGHGGSKRVTASLLSPHSRAIGGQVQENRRNSGTRQSAETHGTDGRDFESISHLEGQWCQGRGWEAFVPSDKKEAEKTKAICQTCTRVNRTERWFCVIYIKGGCASCLLVQK